jgi:hypothetical protein
MASARVCAVVRLTLRVDDGQIGGLDKSIDGWRWRLVRSDMTANGRKRNIENCEACRSQCPHRGPTKQAPRKLTERIVDLSFEATCLDLQLGGPAIGQEILAAVQKHDARGWEVGTSRPG